MYFKYQNLLQLVSSRRMGDGFTAVTTLSQSRQGRERIKLSKERIENKRRNQWKEISGKIEKKNHFSNTNFSGGFLKYLSISSEILVFIIALQETIGFDKLGRKHQSAVSGQGFMGRLATKSNKAKRSGNFLFWHFHQPEKCQALTEVCILLLIYWNCCESPVSYQRVIVHQNVTESDSVKNWVIYYSP